MTDFEILKNEYLEKVNISKNKSRNILLFTDKSVEDIKNTYSKRKIILIEEKNRYVISIKFESAITQSTLNKNFEYNILYSTFKQNENVEVNTDTRRHFHHMNFLKKLFDNNNIDINELKLLSKEQFYHFYRPVSLSPKMICAVNDYYHDKMIEEMKEDFEGITWRPFQQTILDICKGKADARAIYIIEDVDTVKNGVIKRSGNIGKSHVCDKLDLDYNVIIADGKKDNIFNQIKCHQEKGLNPNVIILDIPRQGKDYINYGALESIKNGLIYSGKYEGAKVRYYKPHMFILTNFRVDISQWSSDRIRFIDTKNGKISKSRIPLEEGYSDFIVNDEEVDFESRYYEAQSEYEKLQIENEKLKKK